MQCSGTNWRVLIGDESVKLARRGRKQADQVTGELAEWMNESIQQFSLKSAILFPIHYSGDVP